MMRVASHRKAPRAARFCAPLLVACALTIGPALQLAHAQSHEEEAGEHAEGHGGHAHGGPMHLSDVLHSTEFWGAVINFSLLLLVLHKMGRKPLLSFLSNRRGEMEREISAAADARAKAEAKYQEYSQRLAQLDNELATLRKDIERGAQEDKRRILAEAEDTARRLRRETESLIEQHAKALSDSIRHELVTAAVARAESLLRNAVGASDQQRIAQSFIQSVSQTPAAADAPSRPQPRIAAQEPS